MKNQVQCFPVVQVVNNQVITTSTDVSRKFGRHHKYVLEAVRRLEIPEYFRKANFWLIEKQTPMPNGGFRDETVYQMTRDGFTLLVMGFTGKKAMQYKIAYIEAFNRMESELQKKAIEAFSKVAAAKMLPAPKTYDKPTPKNVAFHTHDICEMATAITDDTKKAVNSLFGIQKYLGRLLQDICVLMPKELDEAKCTYREVGR